MADTPQDSEPRRPVAGARIGAPNAGVRDDDLDPHEGLNYVAKLFKALAILLILMLIGEIVMGLRQDGVDAVGSLLLEAMRTVVFAGAIWAAGDLTVMFVQSHHDLRAMRILLGRLNGNTERLMEEGRPEKRGPMDRSA